MMKAAAEAFRESLLGLDRDEIIGMAVGLFSENQRLNGELSELQEVNTGMAREYQKIKEDYERCAAEREDLIRQNQRLTAVTAKRTDELFGRSSEKTKDILKNKASDSSADTDDPIDEDAHDSTQARSDDVDSMAEAEVRLYLKKLLGEKQKKKKEKGKRGKDLANLPKRVSYIYDITKLMEMYGEGCRIIGWTKTRRVEKARSNSYLQINYYPTVETMDGQVVSPFWEEPLIEKSLVSPSLMASIFYDKYQMCLPYYRQENDPGRFGFPISRQTMSNWETHICEELFIPVYLRLKDLMKGFEYQHCDETTWTVVRDGRGARRKGYFWVHVSGELLSGHGVVFISFELTRAADHLIDFFEGIDHPVYLTDDAYAGYYTLRNEYPSQITVCGCLTHARRRFIDALKVMRIPAGTSVEELSQIPECRCVLKIAEIYKEDEPLKELTSDERLLARRQSVQPLYTEFIDYLKSIDTSAPDVSETFKDAVEYTLSHETELGMFLTDGNIPIDNGYCERLIRTVARIRVNSLFSTTTRGADASAVVMSLVQTAKINGADPYYYLKYLMEELPKNLYKDPDAYLDRMMPWSEEYRAYEEAERQRTVNCMVPPSGNTRPDLKKIKADVAA